MNQAGVPVSAWLLLPKEQGYWFQLDNAAAAARCYDDFKAWTAVNHLQWVGVGLDIEPDYNEFQQMINPRQRWKLIPRFVRRLFDTRSVHQGQQAYTALAARIHADGYRVESYQFPFIQDERRAGSTLLQRLFRIVDFPADLECQMLYTSFMRPVGAGILWDYVSGAQAVAVGSIGGGGDVVESNKPLTWDEFSRDLRLAWQWQDQIAVYSLEGCFQLGYLERLRTFDWKKMAPPPLPQARKVSRLRRTVQGTLWASAHPKTLALGSLLLWVVLRWMRRSRKPVQRWQRGQK